jgi:Methyltransferase TRM13
LQVHQSIFAKFTNPATATTAGSVTVMSNKNKVLMMMVINMVKQLTEHDIYHAIPDWGDFNENNDNNEDEMLLKLLHQGFATHYIKSGGERRHIPQLASLLNNFRIVNVLQPFATNVTSTTITNTTMKQKHHQLVTNVTTIDENDEKEFERPLLFLEMGAGRGMFGLAAAGVANANIKNQQNVQLIMVERTGSRSKADKAFRNIPKDANLSC